MALSLSFIPPPPMSLVSDESLALEVTLNWLATDAAPPMSQRLIVSLPHLQPVPKGTVTIFSPPGPAPAQVSPQLGSFRAATATTPGELRYLVGIEAGKVGNVLLNFSLESPVSADFNLVIT